MYFKTSSVVFPCALPPMFLIRILFLNTRTGRRGEFSFRDHIDMEIGDKFIVVADGGTIEIHGQKKLPWTKLTRTLPKLSAKNGILFDHIVCIYMYTQRIVSVSCIKRRLMELKLYRTTQEYT